MTHLILNGFMGTGKSTVGRLLAGELALTFVDTDDLVEAQLGTTIAEAFTTIGEEKFRAAEAQVVRSVLAMPSAVIALGGGSLLNPETRDMAENRGFVVTLVCEPDEIVDRVGTLGTRPLLSNVPGATTADRVRALLRSRAEAYGRYIQISTSARSPRSVASEIARLYRQSIEGSSATDRSRHVANVVTNSSRRSAIIAGALEDAISSAALEALFARGSHAVLLSDEVVYQHHGERAKSAIEKLGTRVVDIVAPAGEQHKVLATVEGVYSRCQEANLDRESVVVGLGGGVITDIAGFVAATYFRGLPLVLLPSTLLAQVDAAIGGKTGVDFGSAKNSVGSFYPADAVVLDASLLRTLPSPVLSDGLSEMVKMGVIWDAELLELLEALPNVAAILERPDLIERAALNKVEVVRQDPLEQGLRAILNFGHTAGHAIEAASGYRLSHGSSVSLGMLAATRVAVELGVCDVVLLDRLTALLTKLDLPTSHAGLDPDEVLRIVFYDKKRRGGEIRMVLPKMPGKAIVQTVEPVVLRRALAVQAQNERPAPSRSGA